MTRFTQLKSGLVTNKMKIATVVSFRGVYLFSILLMIVRLGEAVPDLKIILKNRASHAGKYSNYMVNICSVRSYIRSLLSSARSKPAYPGRLTLSCLLSCKEFEPIVSKSYRLAIDTSTQFPKGN